MGLYIWNCQEWVNHGKLPLINLKIIANAGNADVPYIYIAYV